ncbi:hypothetical protein [Hyalangium rubrum]|uniref:Uncharacterized protein n=1 Tax=Hyalangium rubrum TaxID=3103134 RepID=A0ABU5HDX2_9BACT|nr:hypothetical protein [Hyalangium sp. s54d21]MDY7231681.1 hypothetical protein [Hyalangium sp. s54d21]
MRERTSLLLRREDFDASILTHPHFLVLVPELSEQFLRRSETLTGEQVIELTAENLLVCKELFGATDNA